MRIKKYTRRDFIVVSAVSGLSVAVLGCKSQSTGEPDKKGVGLSITDVSIPSRMTLAYGADYSFTGKGFAVGDKLIFSSYGTPKTIVTVGLKSVTANSCIFTVPFSFVSKDYQINIERGGESQRLGYAIIEVISNIPDRSGMTVKGMVHVGGVGLAGVVVSDGVEVTQTDAQGIYYLPSGKTKEFVFISVPGGYEVETNTVLPLFYKPFNAQATVVETMNFELKAVNNDKHVVLALGDMHLANRVNDVAQFKSGFLPDAAATIEKYRNEGYKVYGLTLGDMTWDSFWYTNKYSFTEYLNLVKELDVPIFHTIGNHDNDPYVSNDWLSEAAFRKSLGPTYYSFNLGKVHYIVLDNVEYINTGGAQGVVGSTNYNAVIVPAQMAWLKKDLATLTDKTTPVVVAMHIQLNKVPTLNGSTETSSYRLNNAAEFINAFNGFSDVSVLTGHTHTSHTYENSSSMMEHNFAAICATWWWTGRNGYAGNHICKDGAPGGYGIWKFTGRDYLWLYKSIGYEESYQFRAYDLNKIHITAAKFAPNSTEAALKTYSGEYANANNNNEILVNVWGYDKRWKVEILENGNPLTVTRVSALDPLHIVSYEAFRLNDGATPTAEFVTEKTTHMFKAKASKADTPVTVRVTDRFGNVYTETMNRSKDFVLTMR